MKPATMMPKAVMAMKADQPMAVEKAYIAPSSRMQATGWLR